MSTYKFYNVDIFDLNYCSDNYKVINPFSTWAVATTV